MGSIETATRTTFPASQHLRQAVVFEVIDEYKARIKGLSLASDQFRIIVSSDGVATVNRKCADSFRSLLASLSHRERQSLALC